MTREQILAVAKPILFNTDMVQALLDDRKHVTRRVVKQAAVDKFVLSEDNRLLGSFDACHPEQGVYPTVDDAPYQLGDLLYVRETWRVQSAHRFEADARIEFKAGGPMTTIQFPGRGSQSCNRSEYDAFSGKWADDKWHPSIHMPKEAARIFLRAMDVRVERLQGITEEQAKAEGAFRAMEYSCPEGLAIYEDEAGYYVVGFKSIWNACYASPRPAFEHGVITHYESYPWEDIHETRTYKGLPWYVRGNPWVWATEFERMTAE